MRGLSLCLAGGAVAWACGAPPPRPAPPPPRVVQRCPEQVPPKEKNESTSYMASVDEKAWQWPAGAVGVESPLGGAYLAGVRDPDWAAATERVLEERAYDVQLKDFYRLRIPVVHCMTYKCVIAFVARKDYHVPPPRELLGPWSGGVLYTHVLRSGNWQYGLVVLRRHVRDYPAYSPRVRSTDARSDYPECQGDKAGSCACACFPFELDLSHAKCDASGPDGAPHCICPDRAWGDCNAAISPDYKLLPFPTPTPPQHARGKPRSR